MQYLFNVLSIVSGLYRGNIEIRLPDGKIEFIELFWIFYCVYLTADTNRQLGTYPLLLPKYTVFRGVWERGEGGDLTVVYTLYDFYNDPNIHRMK